MESDDHSTGSLGNKCEEPVAPKKTVQKKLKVVLIDRQTFHGYRLLSEDKVEARRLFFENLNKLVAETYDNYRFTIPETTEHVCVAVFDKETRELAGMTLLLRENCRGVEYIEIGVSIVASNYRGLGIQSICMRELQGFMANSLADGIPIIASPRAFSAHSQLQAYNVKMPNDKGELVRIGIPGGFLLYYFVEKDEQGDFVLENDMVFTAWPTLDALVQKEVFLPFVILEKNFWIFNPKYRPDTRPIFIFPFVSAKGEIESQAIPGDAHDFQQGFLVYPENDYYRKQWSILAGHFSIIGFEADQKQIKKSKSKKFTYSDATSPSRIRTIHIESISAMDFASDFEKNMKVITVCLQISDFYSERTKIANTVLMDLLINLNFVPTAQFDLLVNKVRTRVAYFTKWQDVRLEAKYEILSPYRLQFEILNHDVNVQGLGWSKFVNIIEPEGIWALKNDDAPKQDCAYTLDHHFSQIAKGAESYSKAGLVHPVQFPLSETVFYNVIKDYLDTKNSIAEVIFPNEVNVLDHEIIADFENILQNLPLYLTKFNMDYLDVAVLTFRLKNITIKLRIIKKGLVSIEDKRFHSIF